MQIDRQRDRQRNRDRETRRQIDTYTRAHIHTHFYTHRQTHTDTETHGLPLHLFPAKSSNSYCAHECLEGILRLDLLRQGHRPTACHMPPRPPRLLPRLRPPLPPPLESFGSADYYQAPGFQGWCGGEGLVVVAVFRGRACFLDVVVPVERCVVVAVVEDGALGGSEFAKGCEEKHVDSGCVLRCAAG